MDPNDALMKPQKQMSNFRVSIWVKFHFSGFFQTFRLQNASFWAISKKKSHSRLYWFKISSIFRKKQRNLGSSLICGSSRKKKKYWNFSLEGKSIFFNKKLLFHILGQFFRVNRQTILIERNFFGFENFQKNQLSINI